MRDRLMLLLVLVLPALAQWQPDQRLTTDAANSNTSDNNAWCVAASGDTVHVVWYDTRDGNSEIYYKGSTDGGTTWDSDKRLTTDANVSWFPSVAVAGTAVHVVWMDNRDGNFETYYKHSTDGGVTWGSDTRLTTDVNSSNYASVAVAGTAVHVVWNDNRDGNHEIYYKRSTDAGATWGSDTRLTSDAGISQYPSLSVAGSAVHVVWNDNRDGNWETYYKRSTDAGTTWGSDRRLTTDGSASDNPSVALAGNAVHVVWMDYRDGNYEIYYKRDPTGTAAALTVTAPHGGEYWTVGTVHDIAWNQTNGVKDSIYYSTDDGTSWNDVAYYATPPAPLQHAWTIPPTPTTQARVKVVTWNAIDGRVAVVSTGEFAIVAVGAGGWTARAPLPTTPLGKAVKAGGWLTYDNSTKLIYAAKGNKQPDFYAYYPSGDSWRARALIPRGIENKPPYTGAIGFSDGNGHIYATKGNNTQGFYKYDAAKDSWYQKANVPLGLSNKRVKGGTSIVWAYKGSTGSPYLLKGYKNEFYRYDVTTDAWQTLTPAPVGANVKWDKGSWLAYCGLRHTIYAHKAKYHEFYSYNTETDSWSPTALTAMPIPGSGGSRKATDGSCATVNDSTIYAFKGANTQEFWKYFIPTDKWTELETIPRGVPKKKVKAGASLTTMPLTTDRPDVPAMLPALKGNNCNQLWFYAIVTPPAAGGVSDRDGVAGEKRLLDEPLLTLTPNPGSGGFVTLQYSLPGSGPAMVRVYDVTGRPVLPAALITGRTGTAVLDVRSLDAGVYLLKAEGTGFATVRKLVIDR